MKKLIPLCLMLFVLPLLAPSWTPAQPKAPDLPKPVPKIKHGRGLKLPSLAQRKALHAAAIARHGKRALPRATAAVYDSRALGVVPPVRDQGQCGSCWDFGGCGTATVALIAAGYGKADGTFNLSEQFVLDCGQNGGCNGDDNSTVLSQCKATGIPTDDYGPYQGQASQCKSSASLKLYKIADWAYADPGNTSETPVDTQLIKNAVAAYKAVGCAVAAGGTPFWDSGTGTDTGTSRQIDHDVIIVGWDDTHDNGDGSKGAWIMRNSWSKSWGTTCANVANPNPTEGGYGWVKYGADSIGTQANYAIAAVVPPGPVPPGPIPPTPPTPSTTTITLTADQVSAVLAQNNALAITEGTTIKELLDRIEKCREKRHATPPCCGQTEAAPMPAGPVNADRWAEQDKINRAILDALLSIKRRLPPAKKE